MKKERNYPKPVLTPGEVAKRSGVAVSALHFYETKGLIFSSRNGGNQRRYSRDVLRRVAIIKIAQRIGIPLATVSDSLMHVPANKRMSTQEWDALTQHWREELDKHRNPDASAQRFGRLHWLRLPVDARLSTAQSG